MRQRDNDGVTGELRVGRGRVVPLGAERLRVLRAGELARVEHPAALVDVRADVQELVHRDSGSRPWRPAGSRVTVSSPVYQMTAS